MNLKTKPPHGLLGVHGIELEVSQVYDVFNIDTKNLRPTTLDVH